MMVRGGVGALPGTTTSVVERAAKPWSNSDGKFQPVPVTVTA